MKTAEVGRVILNARFSEVARFLKRRVRDNAPCLVVLAFAAAPLRADNVVAVPTSAGAAVTIKLSTPTAAPPRFGFEPVRVSVENAAAHERTWRVAFQAGSGNQFPGLSVTERTITVPAGQTRDTWVFVPVAEPSTAGVQVLAPGAAAPATASGAPPAHVKITPTPTGTKITREVYSPSNGATVMIEETEINATTGELKAVTTSAGGGASYKNSRTSTPPAGLNVTYVIDPVSGVVSTRYTSRGGLGIFGAAAAGPRINIVTAPGSAGAAPAPAPKPPSLAKVTITPTPVGTKVTRITQIGAGGTLTVEQEIDAATGVMTTTSIPPKGTPPPPRSSAPVLLGQEMTFTINPATGAVRTTMRAQSDPTALPKIVIVTAPAPGVGAKLVSATGPVTPPNVVGGGGSPTTIFAEISGPGVAGNGRVMLPNTTGGSQMRPFAVSAALEPTVRGRLSSIVRGAPNLSAVEVAQLPADWRVWSSFAGVILDADEFAALDAGHRAALRGWVGLGGRLWLSPAVAGAEHVEKFGAGFITTLAESLTPGEEASTVPLPAGSPALAARVAARRAAASALAADQATVDLWVNKIKVYDGTPGLPDREALTLEKTLIGEAAQDQGGSNLWLALFLVGFAVVVGPVNLFAFAPAAKRHRLFVTTPLIALAATLILIVTILVQDGLGGDGVRRALVVLLPGDNEAAVFQEQAARTGFLAHRAFTLADDTQLTVLPLDAPDPRMNFNAIASELDRADGRAAGDWFRSRGRQAHLLQRLAPTRGRVERVDTAPDGAPIVQSSLGTTLRAFAWIDEAGKVWTAPEISPGQRIALGREAESGGFTTGGSHRFGEVIEAAAPREPGRWRAHGGATDLAPIATLESVRWDAADVLFTGVLEGGAVVAKEAGR